MSILISPTILEHTEIALDSEDNPLTAVKSYALFQISFRYQIPKIFSTHFIHTQCVISIWYMFQVLTLTSICFLAPHLEIRVLS